LARRRSEIRRPLPSVSFTILSSVSALKAHGDVVNRAAAAVDYNALDECGRLWG
jgi:hypothetical protein